MEKIGSNAPIGVFDSGVGGISVLRKMISLMPNENYIYYGDSANAPYGERPDDDVFRLTVNVFELLLSKGAKGIVVACNTATSVAVRKLRTRYPDLPLVGIEPAIKPACKNHPGGRIIVMATSITLRRPKFAKLLDNFRDQAEIISLPCPDLVHFVEHDEMDSPKVSEYLESQFAQFENHPADAVVLGCTHFPFLVDKIQEAAGKQAVLYDGSNGVAREIRRRLAAKKLLAAPGNSLNVEILNSDGPNMVALAKRLLVK